MPAGLTVLAVCGCSGPFSPQDPQVPVGKAVPMVRYQASPRLFVAGLSVGALAALPDRLLATTVGDAAPT
jgi:hypothetical protein